MQKSNINWNSFLYWVNLFDMRQSELIRQPELIVLEIFMTEITTECYTVNIDNY